MQIFRLFSYFMFYFNLQLGSGDNPASPLSEGHSVELWHREKFMFFPFTFVVVYKLYGNLSLSRLSDNLYSQ